MSAWAMAQDQVSAGRRHRADDQARAESGGGGSAHRMQRKRRRCLRLGKSAYGEGKGKGKGRVNKKWRPGRGSAEKADLLGNVAHLDFSP